MMIVTRSFMILLAFWSGRAVCRGDEGPAAAGVLTLINGNTVPGTLQGSTAGEYVSWQGAHFTRPFEFPIEALSSIHFPAQVPAVRPQGEFAVELSDGDMQSGQITGWSDETVTLQSAHFGTLRIQQGAVRRLHRIAGNPTLIFTGPSGLGDWTFRSPDWKEDGPQIWTDKEGASITGDLGVPDQAVIEFELSWKGTPNFVLALGIEPKAGPDTRLDGWRFETWNGRDARLSRQGNVQVINRQDGAVVRGVIRGDQLPGGVDIAGTSRLTRPQSEAAGTLAIVREQRNIADLDTVMELSTETKRLHLIAYLDQTAGTLQVFLPDGTPAGKIRVPPPAESNDRRSQPGRGIRIYNRNGDLRLERLRIARWNGLLPTSGQDGTSRFELADGSIVLGEIVRLEQEGGRLIVRRGEEELSIDFHQLISAELAAAGKSRSAKETSKNEETETSEPPSGPSHPPVFKPVSVVLQDGTRVSGRFAELSDEALVLRAPEIQEPLSIPHARLRSLSFRSTQEPPPLMSAGRYGRLELGEHRLLGQLTAGTEGSEASCLVWRPDGSRTASPLKPHASGRIVYRERTPPPVQAVQTQQTPPAGRNFAELFLKKSAAPLGTPSVSATSETAAVHVMHLRSGDAIPCHILAIDEEGVRISSPVADAQLVPHHRVKAVELVARASQPSLEAAKKDRLLTVPRLQKASPPTHLLHSKNGDLLRCRLIEMGSRTLRVELHLSEIEIPRDRVAQIIWFHPEEMEAEAGTASRQQEKKDPGFLIGSERLTQLIQQNRENFVKNKERTPATEELVQVIQSNGNRVTFTPREVDGEQIAGTSDVLGVCRFRLGEIDELLFGGRIDAAAAELAYHQWRLRPAVEPLVAQDLEETGSAVGTASPLVGQPAPEIDLELLEGGRFRLSECKGQIIVLDFWATWCGPCMQTMPLMEAALREFDSDRVRLISVNLEETPSQVRAVLERHKLDLAVALDIDGVAARRYQANAIPQMVIVDREGTIARLYVGGGTNVVNQIKVTLTELLAASE